MGTYRLAPQAEDDLYRIWRYGSQRWGVDAADTYIERLFTRFAELANQPLMYPIADEIDSNYRRSVCQNETIYYRARLDVVEIMAIIGKQNATTHLHD